MKPEKVICQNCVFWQIQWAGDEDDPAYGRCLRYPTQQGGIDWNHWCGEWSEDWPAGWIEYEEPSEPETVEVFQFMGGGSLQK
jgi:hypothetical protein